MAKLGAARSRIGQQGRTRSGLGLPAALVASLTGRLPRGVAGGALECLKPDTAPATEIGTGARCLSMTQNSEPTDTDRPSPRADVLPANIDDPRFADHARSDRHPEWTTGSALAADLTEPVDEARTMLTSPEGALALVESGVQAVLEALGSLLPALLSHWGQ
jgi:hypothetical protein